MFLNKNNYTQILYKIRIQFPSSKWYVIYKNQQIMHAFLNVYKIKFEYKNKCITYT